MGLGELGTVGWGLLVCWVREEDYEAFAGILQLRIGDGLHDMGGQLLKEVDFLLSSHLLVPLIIQSHAGSKHRNKNGQLVKA